MVDRITKGPSYHRDMPIGEPAVYKSVTRRVTYLWGGVETVTTRNHRKNMLPIVPRLERRYRVLLFFSTMAKHSYTPQCHGSEDKAVEDLW